MPVATHVKAITLSEESGFRLDGLRVRPATLEVMTMDRREILEPRVMQVLVALARRRGEVVSRNDLIQLCWGGRIVGGDAVTRCVTRLRKLAASLGGFEIETIPRVGVRLQERTSVTPGTLGRRPIDAVLGAVAGLLVGIATGWWVRRRAGRLAGHG